VPTRASSKTTARTAIWSRSASSASGILARTYSVQEMGPCPAGVYPRVHELERCFAGWAGDAPAADRPCTCRDAEQLGYAGRARFFRSPWTPVDLPLFGLRGREVVPGRPRCGEAGHGGDRTAVRGPRPDLRAVPETARVVEVTAGGPAWCPPPVPQDR
jgi:hypothetical protein